MPKKQFPSNPSLVHFKHQAKDLLKAIRENSPEAAARFQEFHRSLRLDTPPTLSDAQLVVAREYGFTSWGKLREYLEAMDLYKCAPHKAPTSSDSAAHLADEFLHLACLTYGADNPSRRDKARQLWADHPELHGASIYIAAATGDVATVRALLAKDPALARARGGPYHWEPLLYAVYSRFDSTAANFSTLEVAALLLKHGADPNSAYLWEGICLFTALTGVFGEGESGPTNQPPHQYEKELATLLLKAGADPNDGQALYNRMFTKGASHLELLFAHGLGQPHKGPWARRLGGKLETPEQMLSHQLHWAASHGHLDRIKLLAEHGVDLNRASHGKSAYEAALLAGNQEIADYLVEKGAQKTKLDPIEAFSAACMSGDRSEVLSLIEQHPELLENSTPHRTQLITDAAGNHRLEAVRLMAELGFDINALGRNTALHEAAWAGDLEMIELLLELGADTTTLDRAHQATPLQWAEYNHKTEAAARLRLANPQPSA